MILFKVAKFSERSSHFIIRIKWQCLRTEMKWQTYTSECIIRREYDAVDNSMFFILSSKERTVLPASSKFAMFVLKGLIGSFPPLKGSRSFEIADLVRGRPWNKTGQRQTYDKTRGAVLSDTLETKLNVFAPSLSLPRSLSFSLSHSHPGSLNPTARESMTVGGRKSVSR